MNDERNLVEIVNADGTVDLVELVGTIDSKRDDKVYVVLTDTSYSEEHSFYSLQNRSNYLLKQCKDKNTFILWG